MSVSWPQCTVIGAGLIGASLAGAGRAAGIFGKVVAAGRSQSNLHTVLVHGLADEVTTDVVESVAGADLIVLATPGVRAIELLSELASVAPASAVFTDVGSVKEPVVVAAARCGLAERFVGAHPLAGKADSGAAAADIELFRDRLCVLTPTAETDPDATDRVAKMWEAVGARTMLMDASAHDQALATTSHLPQMAAFALAATAAEADEQDSIVQLIAAGFRDTTRLAASNSEIWSAIAHLNRAHLLSSLDSYTEVLGRLREAVANSDGDTLVALFEEARRFRKELDK
ncbi:MAG: prephenate dehydrogenase [Hyphomicrobiaceae bacterium]|jgi:prephenate dehydrogenase